MPVITTAILVDVTTTTIFPSSTATTPTASNASTAVPVGAIAGGTSAGVFLAVALVIAWTVWGRSIKRTKAKQQKKADELRITKQNTMRNAAATFSKPKPKNYSYKPLFWPPSEPKVKFADGSSRKMPSRPKPLVPSRVAHDIPASPPPEPVPRTVRPPPAPVQGTDNSEFTQGNSQMSALLGALRASGQRLSTASSLSWFSKSTGNQSEARLSQATSGSSYSQPSVNRSTTSVGMAY